MATAVPPMKGPRSKGGYAADATSGVDAVRPPPERSAVGARSWARTWHTLERLVHVVAASHRPRHPAHSGGRSD